MGSHLRVLSIELSNEYQHERVQVVFKTFCIFLPWTKVASAWKGLTHFGVILIRAKSKHLLIF